MTGWQTWRTRIGAAFALACAGLLAGPAAADPADIEAAARGVVRVVIVEADNAKLEPISHGTGFAIGPERIVTNAHVVAEARGNADLAIAIVPSDGEDAVYARIIAISPRNDLALLATTSPMRLPPLTIAGNPPTDSGAVTAVGYPMNVDRAQGLSIGDIFNAQPPVRSTGFLSGRRPTREFDSLLHTAPIARGNSGGPLLDECGRVIGVNSFGAESGSSDGEFYFAASNRELLPFLRANDITPAINGLPCRSIAELDAAERAQAERARMDAQFRAETEQRTTARRREQFERYAVFAVMTERDNGLALAMVLLLVGLGAGGFAYQAYGRDNQKQLKIAASIAGLAVLGAFLAWILRPDFASIDDRVNDALLAETAAAESSGAASASIDAGRFVCVLDPARSKVTGADTADVPLEWRADGCVNGRTQYGFADGAWARVFTPSEEATVSVNRFDPATREYRMERYLLDRESMTRLREARGEFQAPACGAGSEAAGELGDRQQAMLSLLPETPNERLVYRCGPARAGS
ncbi:MAG: protease [Sphingomonadales bacterium 32-68-7]|nr:MAG: protease [Sphingomonadales bacterium 12-68-11]OYX09015.1 MAG: protease [Sphingomonadales bacterium 32-68-7]